VEDDGVKAPIPRWLSAALLSAALVVAITVVIALLDPRAPAVDLGVLYLLAVVPIALLYGTAVAGAVSVACMVTFNFFFLTPRHSLDPGTWEHGGLLLAFLVSSVVVSQLAALSQRQARRSARLADEQAALRRVAMLIARGAPPPEVFAVVAGDVGALLGADATHMARYELDGTATGVATWSPAGGGIPVGTRVDLEGESVAELVLRTGRPARMHGYEHASGAGAALGRDLDLRSSVGGPIVVDGRLWGVLIASTKGDGSFPDDAEARIAAFTELVATAISNTEARTHGGRLAEEQAALRRVATLVARGSPPGELFQAVTEEAGTLLGADLAAMARHEADHTLSVLATWAAAGEHPEVGAHFPLVEGDLATTLWQTGRPARIVSDDGVPARIAAIREQLGIRSSVGSPILVDGRTWGGLVVHSKQTEPLPRDIEERLGSFTELLATAIANAESRAGLARLAEEQAALRRVATLVARGAPPEGVFAMVAEEAARLLPTASAAMARYESDGTMSLVATSSGVGDRFPVGARWALGGKNVSTMVAQTGRSARIDSYADASGPVGVAVRERGFQSSVGTPIMVEGHLWGLITATSEQLLPADTEGRLVSFTELLATAVANAEGRAELMASRARIVTAADETRRRIERDLHDGVQQRLVSVGLELRAAQATVPSHLGELDGALSRVAEELASLFDELREISHGIHPSVLSEGGLAPALSSLRRRSVLPVKLELHAERRLPKQVEVAAYYVVSEALTNAAKHANASVVNVELDTRDTILQLAIRDDGIGGADRRRGSGLVGLSDRIEALGGTLQVSSPAGNGTTLLIEIPIDGQTSAVSI
jgi:signal transduction histidine kinase